MNEKEKKTYSIDEVIAKLDTIFEECGLGKSIPDNSKVGESVVRTIPNKRKQGENKCIDTKMN